MSDKPRGISGRGPRPNPRNSARSPRKGAPGRFRPQPRASHSRAPQVLIEVRERRPAPTPGLLVRGGGPARRGRARRSPDPEVHGELCELLDHDTRGSRALEAGLDSGALAALAADVVSRAGDAEAGGDLETGASVGPYTVGRALGSGGFANVYEAKQTEPVTRDVALKVLRPGMDSKHVLARFSAELQAQARMEHEHVARVFDAGSTADGRPFLAMELVDGAPITGWCGERGLGLEARLALFVQACDAVQHAHQKGVVHRDLKPSNVLVTAGGEHGSVKIIDFGIAKAIEGSLTENTLRTLDGQLIGTPEYMSPEQAGRVGDDVDTRTDVYSLGVLLFELLTGTRPFDFGGAPLFEVQRRIHEEEPPRPSQRVALASADAAWMRALRTDLDWVVLRALEKDPERRFDAVAGLSADVQRFLRDEPLEASPPSGTVRVRKFVRRHRTVVGAAALIALSLIAGLTWALIERGRAEEARELALARAREAEQVSGFQGDQFTDIDLRVVGDRIRERLVDEVSASAERAQLGEDERTARLAGLDAALRGANLTNVAVGLLDEAFLSSSIATIEERYADQPRIQARLLHSVAYAQYEMGLVQPSLATFEDAVALALEAFGPEHPQTVESRFQLAGAYGDAGRWARSEELYTELLERFGEDDARRSSALMGLAKCAAARDQVERVLELRAEAYELSLGRFGPGDARTLAAQGALASATEDPSEAEALHRAAIQGLRTLEDADPVAVMTAEENYASFLEAQRRSREALAIRNRTVDALRSALGDRHRTTLRSIESLGLRYYYDADYAEAEVWLREAYQGRLEAYGPNDLDTIGAAANYAMILGHLGRATESLEIYEQVLPAQRAAFGLEHPDTLGTLTNLGVAYIETDQFERAVEVLEQSLELKRRVLGMEHRYTPVAMTRLIQAYQGLGRHDEALELRREHLELMVSLAERPNATPAEMGRAAEDLMSVEYRELLDPVRGLELASRAAELEEVRGGSTLYLQVQRMALAHWYLGDFQAGYETQLRAIEVGPEHAQDQLRAFLKNFEDRLAREAQEGE
ncbi:MAG: tetratricopeptide repeat protein [Planctomycetota bacterium]